MNVTALLLALVALFFIYFIIKGFKIVSQSETMVVERLGKYHRTLAPGVNIIFPIIDQPRKTLRRQIYRDGSVGFVMANVIDLREQVYDFPKQNVITKDNVQTKIDALLYFQIVNPVAAIYEIENLTIAMEKLTQTTLRNVIGELELDETLTSRDTINAKLRYVLDEATNKWGVKVNRVELQDITPPESVRVAMEQQMQAERRKRAEILNAQGEKQAAILASEGQKQSMINAATARKEAEILKAEGLYKSQVLAAEAEAVAIKQVTEAISHTNVDPANYLLAIKYIETLRELTSGKDNKTVLLPYEATSLLGSLGGIKEMFLGAAAGKPQ